MTNQYAKALGKRKPEPVGCALEELWRAIDGDTVSQGRHCVTSLLMAQATTSTSVQQQTLVDDNFKDTPATRTGPPRSLSFAYTLPCSATRVSHFQDKTLTEDPELLFSADSYFRGALGYATQNDLYDRKGGKTRRDKGKSPTEEIWNPRRWFHESPREEKAAIDFPLPDSESSGDEANQPFAPPTSPPQSLSKRPTIKSSKPSSTAKTALRRAFSLPLSHTETPSHKGKGKEKGNDSDNDTSQGPAKWAKLRSLLPHIAYPNQSILPGPSVVTSHAVNITDELITGGLSTLMLRLWFERDEKGRRRVPVLFHRLRIRVSDSLYPYQRHSSVFRIECEYANGAARWVIYRELRDFVSLHTHYTVSNAVYNRNMDKLPEFPMTSTCLISLF